MSTQPTRSARPDHVSAIWGSAPIPSEPRPWPLAALTLGSIALVIAGSLGPWLYIERGSSRAIEVTRLAGINTDGILSLGFALVAAIAVLVALARPRLWVVAWGAFVAMVLCTLVGLFDWVLFDPMDFAPGPAVRYVRVEWGLKLLTIAAPIGAVCSILFARHLMRGDY